MKIGDRIYVRGYVDEIRKDTVIVRNDGGYFGTIPSEVITGELPPAQPVDKDINVPTNDTISRQAAIDAIKGEIEINGYSHVVDVLKQLPPAQPEKRTETHACDLISRQAVMKGISLSCTGQSDVIKAEAALVRYVKKIPSTEPEIIRCKDCIYFDKYIDCKEMYQWDGFCADWARNTYENWYCSRAERRNDE